MELAKLRRHLEIAQANERRARSDADRVAYSGLVTYYTRLIREREREKSAPLLPRGH